MTMPPPNDGTVPVLLYHSVSESPPGWIAPFTVTQATFARHLDLIGRSGRQALTVSSLVARRRAGDSCEQAVVITFDDGYADFANEALPTLMAAGLPATLYLTTGALRGCETLRAWEPLTESPLLSWSQLPGIEAAGIELGAHTRTHRLLDLLSTAEARAEIEGSRADLEDALGHPVESLAYPHGHANRRVRLLARAAGFSSATAVRNALSPADDDPYRIARLTVTASTADRTMEAWLSGKGAVVADPRDRRRAVAGRVARRLQRRHRVVSVPEGLTTTTANLHNNTEGSRMNRAARS